MDMISYENYLNGKVFYKAHELTYDYRSKLDDLYVKSNKAFLYFSDIFNLAKSALKNRGLFIFLTEKINKDQNVFFSIYEINSNGIVNHIPVKSFDLKNALLNIDNSTLTESEINRKNRLLKKFDMNKINENSSSLDIDRYLNKYKLSTYSDLEKIIHMYERTKELKNVSIIDVMCSKLDSYGIDYKYSNGVIMCTICKYELYIDDNDIIYDGDIAEMSDIFAEIKEKVEKNISDCEKLTSKLQKAALEYSNKYGHEIASFDERLFIFCVNCNSHLSDGYNDINYVKNTFNNSFKENDSINVRFFLEDDQLVVLLSIDKINEKGNNVKEYICIKDNSRKNIDENDLKTNIENNWNEIITGNYDDIENDLNNQMLEGEYNDKKTKK